MIQKIDPDAAQNCHVQLVCAGGRGRMDRKQRCQLSKIADWVVIDMPSPASGPDQIELSGIGSGGIFAFPGPDGQGDVKKRTTSRYTGTCRPSTIGW